MEGTPSAARFLWELDNPLSLHPSRSYLRDLSPFAKGEDSLLMGVIL